MDSAEGQVQQMHYVATFPLLLNISDQPTYFMAMKDAAELVKMYAMVNVNQYQIVATGATVAECEKNYRQMLVQNGLVTESTPIVDSGDTQRTAGKVKDIRSFVVNGTTQYYVILNDGQFDTIYRMSAAEVPEAALLNVGDYISIDYEVREDEAMCAGTITGYAVMMEEQPVEVPLAELPVELLPQGQELLPPKTEGAVAIQN